MYQEQLQLDLEVHVDDSPLEKFCKVYEEQSVPSDLALAPLPACVAAKSAAFLHFVSKRPSARGSYHLGLPHSKHRDRH